MPPARIFVHPRCYQGPALGSLITCLEAHNWNCEKLSIGPLTPRNHRELVREISQDGANTVYERMDGSQFAHRMGQPAPPWEPEAA